MFGDSEKLFQYPGVLYLPVHQQIIHEALQHRFLFLDELYVSLAEPSIFLEVGKPAARVQFGEDCS